MDEALTWRSVADLLKPLGRGAPLRLSKALDMNSSDFYRRLKRPIELTERQAAIVRGFISGQEGVDQPTPPAAHSSRGEGTKLPVFGYAAASDGDRVALNEGAIIDYYELPPGIALAPGDYFVVRPLGSSMEPRIFPGETLVVRRGYPPAHNKDVVIEFKDGSGVVKTYRGQRDGRVFGEQFNEPKVLDWDATTVKALHAVAFKI